MLAKTKRNDFCSCIMSQRVCPLDLECDPPRKDNDSAIGQGLRGSRLGNTESSRAGSQNYAYRA